MYIPIQILETKTKGNTVSPEVPTPPLYLQQCESFGIEPSLFVDGGTSKPPKCYQILNAKYQIPNTKYKIQNTICRMPNTKY